MGGKRDRGGHASVGNEESVTNKSNKRRRNQPPGKPDHAEAPVDPTYGQRAAFPGLDEPVDLDDNELEFEDVADALSYLRSVRQEAGTIPNLLVAPKAGPQLPPGFYRGGHNGSLNYGNNGDSRAYYDDGAYIAAPDTESSEDAQSPHDDMEYANQQIREAFYASIVSQFSAIRKVLHRKPPKELIKALPPDYETYVGHFGSRGKVAARWARRIRNLDPRPVQIAAMSTESVFKLIRVLLKGRFMTPEDGLRERTSRWIWALLAKLPDRGEMDHNDISWIRELGKRAVLLMVEKEHAAALREQMQEDDLDGSDFEDNEDHEILPADPEVERDEGEVVEDPSGDIGNADEISGEPEAATNTPGEEEEDDLNGEMAMDLEDGEVSSDDDATPGHDTPTDIELAKARLLSNLEVSSTPANETNQDEEQEKLDAETRSIHNTYATLNMILTVAGEFYGQRDLLDFRNPFPGE